MNKADWKNTTIGQVCLIGDGAHAKIKRQKSGILYLTSRNFKNGKLELSKVDYISISDYKKYFRSDSKALTQPQKDDIVFSIIGTIGEPYLYTKEDCFGISSAVSILRADKSKINPKYLFYWIKGYIFQNALYSIKGGVAQSYVSLEMIKSLPLDYPHLPTQRKIAGILSAYDDLIENNTRRIEILEEMARMLYREWFVKFRFPVDDVEEKSDRLGNGRGDRFDDSRGDRFDGGDRLDDRSDRLDDRGDRLGDSRSDRLDDRGDRLGDSRGDRFDGGDRSDDGGDRSKGSDRSLNLPELVESELGLIPKGWEVKPIGEVIETLGGGTPSTNKDEYWLDGDIQWFVPKNLTSEDSMFINDSEKKITELGLKKSSAKMFPAYSVMMTSRATLGVKAINTKPACTNQGFITCIPNEKVSAYQIYFWIEENMQMINNLATGATFKEITKTNFRNLPILIADNVNQNKFLEKIEPICKQIEILQNKNINLRKTRDLLLPRLISGEIDVENLDINIGKIKP